MDRSRAEWPTTAVLREVWRSLLANWKLHCVSFVTMGSVIFFVSFTDLSAAKRAVDFERQEIAFGRHTVRAQSTEPGRESIDAARCIALAENPIVRSSGWLTGGGPASVPTNVGTPFRVVLGSPGLVSVLDPAVSEGLASASSSLARQLGLSAGSFIQLEDPSGAPLRGSFTTFTQFDPSPRHEFGEILWFLAEERESAAECWVDLEKSAEGLETSIVRSKLDPERSSLSISVLSARNETDLTPIEQYRLRATAGLHPWIGLTLALQSGATMWFRRKRGSIYRSTGLPTVIVMLSYLVELWWVNLTGALVGFSAGLLVLANSELAPIEHGLVGPVAQGIATVLLVAGGGSALIACLVASGNPVEQLKDD